jgi:hypothetical protein
MSHLAGDDLQIRFPHVAAHKSQSCDHLRSQHLQAAPQGDLGSPFSHPQQSSATSIDLVNDGQKTIRLLPPPPIGAILEVASERHERGHGQEFLYGRIGKQYNGGY